MKQLTLREWREKRGLTCAIVGAVTVAVGAATGDGAYRLSSSSA